MGQKKRGEQVLVGKHEVKIFFGMPRRGLNDNIKMDLNNGTGERRIDLTSSGERQGVGICEHRNERSGFRTTCRTS